MMLGYTKKRSFNGQDLELAIQDTDIAMMKHQHHHPME